MQKWCGSCYLSHGVKQAHAEGVMGHAREYKEVDGTLQTSCQGTRPLEKLAVLALEINFMLEAKELCLKNAISRLPSTKSGGNNSVE